MDLIFEVTKLTERADEMEKILQKVLTILSPELFPNPNPTLITQSFSHPDLINHEPNANQTRPEHFHQFF